MTQNDLLDLTRASQMKQALEAEKTIAKMSGPECLSFCLDAGIWTQGDLSKASGLAPNTITAFKQGKRPNAAQRAALCWALAKRFS